VRKSRGIYLKESLKRNEVKPYIPPPSLEEIAQDRTKGIVGHFLDATRGMDFLKALDCLDVLARSCYLQALRDCVDAVKGMEKKDGPSA
jgi:hypothetical protein